MADPITLGISSMAASGASGAAGIFSSLFGGSAKADAYKYQSSMAWQNAAIAKQNQKYALDIGEQQAEKAGIAGPLKLADCCASCIRPLMLVVDRLRQFKRASILSQMDL